MDDLYWWREAEPTYRGESDGQEMLWAYARFEDGEWEYVVVRLSDGDGPEHTLGGYRLRRGVTTEIPAD